jgi:hypothetical protein
MDIKETELEDVDYIHVIQDDDERRWPSEHGNEPSAPRKFGELPQVPPIMC